MDSDQRIVALKKAFADMIFNLSKEAASRVAASEQRAHQLRFLLQQTKEDATTMMLRLKNNMDDKINEAEVTRQNKQEKINDLEAQLQEAEDIVINLRHAKDKYETAINNHVHSLDKHDKATLEGGSAQNRQRNSQYITFPRTKSQNDFLTASEKEKLYLNQRTELPNYFLQQIQTRNSYGTMPELPSIISRSKYRKGCNQRINAFERDIYNGGLYISRQLSSERKDEVERQDNGVSKTSSEGVGMTFDIRSKEIVNEDGSINCCYELQPRKLINLKSKITGKQRNNSITDSLSPRSDENPSLPRSHRAIKYTYERKRKRNTVSISDGNVSVENCTAKRKEDEEKTQFAKPEKSSSVLE